MATIALVHGLGGTGATMQPLTDALRALGHECIVPTLPGHGTTVDDLRTRTWAEWLAAVPEAEILVGQSMGAALCLAAAGARGTAVTTVVAINCPAPDPDAVDGLEWRVSRGHDLIDGPPLGDGEEGYEQLPLAALLQMANGILGIDLASITANVTLVSSALDDVVDPSSADVLSVALSQPAQRLTLPHSGHVATLGPDLHLIVAAIA
ncbi:MAG: hypothetical protein RJB65_2467 [Actinomycetota bacterium]|jgi:carboxylesterase